MCEKSNVLPCRHGSKTIYQTLLKIRDEQEERSHLDQDQVRILERYLMEYKHQGYELAAKKQDELQQTWNPRLAEAVRDYNYKIYECTHRFSSTVKDPNVVRDFPIDVLKAMAIDRSVPIKRWHQLQSNTCRFPPVLSLPRVPGPFPCIPTSIASFWSTALTGGCAGMPTRWGPLLLLSRIAPC